MKTSVKTELPRVTVVTPSYNMGRYLRETIESVLAQDYPNLEYIVMDGGSTDETLSILAQYKDRIRFESRPDLGAADAINRGFVQSHGEIFTYLNADDTYLPGAIRCAVHQFMDSPDVAAVYGNAYWISNTGQRLGTYPTLPFDRKLLERECYICQPASFVRRAAFAESGMLNVKLQYTFDYDFWIRVAERYRMRHVDVFFASSRMHAENKTLGERRHVLRETVKMLREHFGYVPFARVHAYSAHLLDGRDQFFEQPEPSIMRYLLSLLLGLWYNRWHPVRYVREWSSVMTFQALVRRWHGLVRR